MQNDNGFKFSLGATVRHVTAGEPMSEKESQKTWGNPDREQRWFVLERLLQECPGGIQRHYVCRGVTRNGGITSGSYKFLEQELQESEPFKAKK